MMWAAAFAVVERFLPEPSSSCGARIKCCEEEIDWTGMGWWAGRMAGFAGFVGRDRELSGLRAALEAGTRLLLVVGDAGVGKTRFAREGMRRAAADGVVSVWGGCLPLAEKLPLLPVAEALGELSRLDGGGLLEAARNTVDDITCDLWAPGPEVPLAQVTPLNCRIRP